MLALLGDVSDGDARLIDALAIGVTRSGLDMLAEQAGVTTDRVDEVLAHLAGSLMPPERASSLCEKEQTLALPAHSHAGPRSHAEAAQGRARPPLAVIGRGIGAERVAAVLLEAGHPVMFAITSEGWRGRAPAATVLVSGHVFDPFEHQHWLRRDVPHLPIVFSEAGVTIGPLVIPGFSACLTCVERQRTEVDPAWPAVASQLWGTAATAECGALATEAAVEAVRMLRTGIPLAQTEGRVTGENETAKAVNTGHFSVRLDSDSGERTTREWLPSGQCGCRELTADSGPESRREIGSGPARRVPTSPVVPTTTEAMFVPA